MTAIIGVLNSQGIAIAADSAVTVTGNHGKKVYNRSNKIFTLSKFHPVGIAIYNSADFLGIPLETLIKMFRKKLKDTSNDTVEAYKMQFLEFVKSQLEHVSAERKQQSFFSFCNEAYSTILNNSIIALNDKAGELAAMAEIERTEAYKTIITEEITKYQSLIDGYPKANYIDLTEANYYNNYAGDLNEIIVYVENGLKNKFPDFAFTDEHKTAIKKIMYSLINIEFIFETYSGLVFIGFGEKEIYPTTQLVLLGCPIAGQPRMRIYPELAISPGKTESNIIPFAQGDVTTTVLTGVDPNYKEEVKNSIKKTFETANSEIAQIIEDPAQSQLIKSALDTIGTDFIQKLEQYQFEKITGPLLEILAHMGKEDMSELAESLVNITSLKRKFTSSNSSDESVGGPVDVAIITKGDGFIWMKRKHYFSGEYNPGFMDKYYKS